MDSDVVKKTNSAVWFRLLFKGGQQVIALVMGIILARILSPAEFGVVALANMIIYYANTFTNFGLNNALVQKDNLKKDHINTVFTLDFILSLLLVVITVLMANRIADFFHDSAVGPVIKWMSLYYVITSFHYIPVAILRRNIDFKFLTVIEFVEGISASAIAILLALAGYSYWSIVVASLLVPTLITIILMIKTRWFPKIILCNNMNDLYSFGFWNFIRGQLDMMVSKVDYFVIGRYLDVKSLGTYEKTFELTARAMTGLSMPVNGIFFSTFSRIRKDIKQVKKIFLEAVSLLALICYPVLMGLGGVAPHFVMSCLGSQWEKAIIPLQVMAAGSLFRVLFGMVANVNVTIGKYRIHTLLSIISAVIFIVLCFWFVHYGLIAVSIAYALYCFINFFISFSLTQTIIHIKYLELLGAVWCPLVGSFIMLCAVIALRTFVFIDSTSFVELICLSSIGAAIYLVWGFYFYKKGIISFRIKGIKG